MGNIRIRVAIIVELLDRMTGAPVKKGQAYIDPPGGQKMIVKDNGCFVFLHPLTEGLTVEIKSHIFKKQNVELSVEPDGLKHIRLWLEPNKDYVYPVGTTFIEGDYKALKKHAKVCAIPAKESRAIRLSADYKKGDETISLYGINEKVEERKYILWQADEPVSKIFTIKANGTHPGTYILQEPLAKNYRKGEIQVRNVYETELDDQKHIYMALRNIEEDTKAILMVDDKVKKTIELLAGKTNTL